MMKQQDDPTKIMTQPYSSSLREILGHLARDNILIQEAKTLDECIKLTSKQERNNFAMNIY